MVISKRVKRTRDSGRPVADNYRRLAEYISNDNDKNNEEALHQDYHGDIPETLDLDDDKRLPEHEQIKSDSTAEAGTQTIERNKEQSKVFDLDGDKRLTEQIEQVKSDSIAEEDTDTTEGNEGQVEIFDLDDYKRLAEYMKADGETEADSRIVDRADKLHSLWIDNCEAGECLEFLDMAIAEIEVTQDQNTRAKSGKTYHQMTSFRKEDGIPSEEVLRDMVQEYARALDFEDHQRIVACHQDTDNFHFHIAYNKIHPETFKCHSPSWDYYKRDTVDRAMEAKHGLAVDNGVRKGKEQGEEHEKKPTGAADMEAHRWEESFDGYVKRHKGDLKGVVSQAKGWQDVHEGFAEYDLELKKHANGLVIASRTNKKHQIKASDIDRGFSKASLEKRFGAFQTPNDGNKKKAKETYKPRPTTKHKGQERLWNAYRATPKARHKGWKSFLYQMAMIQDPLAIAIIQGQKMILRSLFDVSSSTSPVASRKPQRKPSTPRTYFPDIRSSEAKEAKKRGARWDKEKKQWYAGSKEALLSLTVMKSPLVQERIREERNRKRLEERVYLDVPLEGKDKAKKAGARWDNEKKSWYAPKRDTAKKIVSSSSAVKSEHQKQRELGKFASSLQYQSLLTTSLTRSKVNKNIRSAVEKYLLKENDKGKEIEI